VFLSAAKVGGIGYNKEMPADFIRENLQIQTNVIDAAYRNGCKKLLFLGSACIYPKLAPVPIKEEYLMTGPLEETNISYSLAKIAGYMMCKKYTEQYGFPTVSVMPNNLYGVNDNFILDQCHVIPSFINKFINAKDKNLQSVVCFGDGSPTREFLFSDDLADGLIFLMDNYNDPEIINIGPNREVSIKELSELIAKTVGYTGEIVWDTTKPNGTPRRALDTSRMDSLGWKSQTSLEDGLNITIDWFLKNRENYVRL
jgi:GDP-L-fucose synthase